jgi:AmmeMemoRadiSam system protein B
MRKIRLLLCCLLLGAIILTGKPLDSREALNVPEQADPVIRCNFFDMSSFLASYEEISNETGSSHEKDSSTDGEKRAIGAIVPHHLVAGPMIARLFDAIKEETPGTIIIIAPNHKRVGERMLHTGAFSWDTPFGKLDSDSDVIEDLIGTFGAGVNPKLLEEEHSIAALVPYVRYIFPESKIVPVLVHGNTNRMDCSKLARLLAETAWKKSCLILASIDFSHGLKPNDALKNDEITQRTIDARDYDSLLRLDNRFLDAPPTLCTFLMAMDIIGNNESQETDTRENRDGYDKGIILEHGEASRFLKYHVPETTSYMTYIFTVRP